MYIKDFYNRIPNIDVLIQDILLKLKNKDSRLYSKNRQFEIYIPCLKHRDETNYVDANLAGLLSLFDNYKNMEFPVDVTVKRKRTPILNTVYDKEPEVKSEYIRITMCDDGEKYYFPVYIKPIDK